MGALSVVACLRAGRDRVAWPFNVCPFGWPDCMPLIGDTVRLRFHGRRNDLSTFRHGQPTPDSVGLTTFNRVSEAFRLYTAILANAFCVCFKRLPAFSPRLLRWKED